MVTTGKTNVSVQSQASITFVDGWNETWFGQGALPGGIEVIIATNWQNNYSFYNGSYCNDSAPAALGTGTPRVKPLCIENDGNNNETCVKIAASSTPAGWITCTESCAQTPNATIKAYENGTAGSVCTGGLRSDWGQLNTTQRTLCEQFNTSKVMGVDVQLTLPQNTESDTELSTTITIYGTDAC